jgi:hypothetical protein
MKGKGEKGRKRMKTNLFAEPRYDLARELLYFFFFVDRRQRSVRLEYHVGSEGGEQADNDQSHPRNEGVIGRKEGSLPRDFAPIPLRPNADDAHVRDHLVRQEETLEFGGSDLKTGQSGKHHQQKISRSSSIARLDEQEVARDEWRRDGPVILDQLLATIDDVPVPLGVDPRDIACLEPSVGRQRTSVSFGVVQIASVGHHPSEPKRT